MDILSTRKIEALLNEGFRKVLIDKGFVQETESPFYFRREDLNRVDFITYPGIKTYHQYFFTLPKFSRYINSVEKYWIDLAPKINIQVVPHFATIALFPQMVKPGIVNEPEFDKTYNGYKATADAEGIERFFEMATPLIDNYLLPAADRYLDLREIDQLVNAEVKYRGYVQGFLGTEGTEFKRLIIAKLTGNPIYDQLVELFSSSYNWYKEQAKESKSEYWGNYPEVFEILFERLKDVQPL